MAVALSPIGGAGAQFFDNNGVPLSGGKLYTYQGGTTTPAATYTSLSGTTAHTNPIILDSAGRVPSGEIWLTLPDFYKFVLKTPTDVTIGTWDNIQGYSSGSVAYAATEVQTATANQTLFVLTEMFYNVGTNTLAVYVDGVNQVINNAYVESTSTTVTFMAGLHVGALVKFVNVNVASADASAVSYEPGGAGAVATNVQTKLRESLSIDDFGASPSATAAANTVAIQAAFDSLDTGTVTSGGTVHITGNSADTYAINDTIVASSPVTIAFNDSVYRLLGSGMANTTLQAATGLQDKAMLDFTPTGTPTAAYSREIRDLRIDANNIAKYGIDAQKNRYSLFDSIDITGCKTAGPNIAAGIVLDEAIQIVINRVKVSFSEGHGVFVKGTNYINGGSITNCTFWYLTGTGYKSDYGNTSVTLSANVFEHVNKGIELAGIVGPTTIDCNYFEDNKYSHIELGTFATQRNVSITNNYFLVYPTAWQDATFCPIVLNNSDGIIITGNNVPVHVVPPTNGYMFLNANVPGKSVSRCVVENNNITREDPYSPDYKPYEVYNIAPTWVDYQNSLKGDYATFLQENLNTQDFSDWTLAGTAGGILRDANIMGGVGYKFTGMSNSVADSATKVFNLPSSTLGRFVTIGVPVKQLAGGFGASSFISMTTNGTHVTTGGGVNTTDATVTANFGSSTVDTVRYLTQYVPADATTLTVVIQNIFIGQDWLVGYPCLYVGATPWYINPGDDNKLTTYNVTSSASVIAFTAGQGTTLSVTGLSTTGFKTFTDLITVAYTSVAVVSSNSYGSPGARTYLSSGNLVTLAVAGADTFTVQCIITRGI